MNNSNNLETALVVTSRRHGTFRILLDPEDWQRVNEHTWSVSKRKADYRRSDGRASHNNDHVYFVTTVRQPSGRYKTIYLHRLILDGAAHHVIGNQSHTYVDLRKHVLRVGTIKHVNERMRKTTRPTSSRFKGVSWINDKRKWQASISINDRMKNLGRRTSEEDAARLYDLYALANYSNPLTNYPPETYAGIDLARYVLTMPDRSARAITSAVHLRRPRYTSMVPFMATA